MSGIAATFTVTSGWLARAEPPWIACASSSLPVPVSPSNSTGDSSCAARRAWRFTSRLAALVPTKLREGVLGAPRLRERLARRDQFLLHARVVREKRRERLQFVEQREADRADRFACVVLQRQARDDERLAVGFQHVEQDRLAGHHDFAHQAVRDHRFAIAADRLLGIRKAETRRITLVDPDDARIRIDDERAFAEILESAEQRIHRAPQYVAVGGGKPVQSFIMCRCLRYRSISRLSQFGTSLSHQRDRQQACTSTP